MTRDQIKYLETCLTHLHKLAGEQKYDKINVDLQNQEFVVLPVMFVIGVLRATFAVKHKLDYWSVLLEQTKKRTQKWFKGLG